MLASEVSTKGLLLAITLLVLAAVMPLSAYSQKQGAADLAAAAQNPIANMISVPFQNNTFFDIGPKDGTANVLNIQPVYPVSLNENWNLITRTIVPLIYVGEDIIEGLPELPMGVGAFGCGSWRSLDTSA